MAANRRWASREDWERHRPLITRLYIDEQQSLAEVVDTLRLDHDFFATDRLHRWGLYKYATVNNAEPKGRRKNATTRIKGSRASNSASFNELTLRFSHTKCMDAVYNTPNTATREIHDIRQPEIELVPYVALPRSLSASKYTTFEAIFRLFHNYLLGDGVVFDRPYWTQETVTFYRTTETAARLLDAKDMRGGFQALDNCFGRFQNLVDSSEYGVIPFFFIVLARLPPEVAQMLLRFADRMTAIRLAPGHPLSSILDVIRTSGPGVIRENCDAIVRGLFACLEDRLGPASENAMLLESSGLDMMHYLVHRAGGAPARLEAFEARTRAINRRLARFGFHSSARWGNLNYGYSCLRARRYAEASAIADDALRWAEIHPDDEQLPRLKRASTHLKWRVEGDIGSPDSYAAAAVQYCQLCPASGRPDDYERFITAVAEVKAWFEKKGKPELAQKVLDEIMEPSLAQ